MKNQVYLPALAAFCIGAAACSPKAEVKGMLTGAPDTQIVVKQLTTSSDDVIDRSRPLRTDPTPIGWKSGKANPNLSISTRRRNCFLLLEKGDRVKVVSDTLGNYSVEGSGESLKLQQIERISVISCSVSVSAGWGTILCFPTVHRALSFRSYICDENKSITTIPVLYQRSTDFRIQPVHGRDSFQERRMIRS